jgi:Tannase and feruloyl esterase
MRGKLTVTSVSMLSLVAGTTMVLLSEAGYAADNPAAIVPALKCEALRGFSVPSSTLLIEKADVVTEAPPATVPVGPPDPETVGVTIPSNCRAQGVIDKRVGGDGKNYAIGFAIALPDRWNGRLMYQGGGGLNGSIRPPLGAQAAGDQFWPPFGLR